jgi:hypothetical protein
MSVVKTLEEEYEANPLRLLLRVVCLTVLGFVGLAVVGSLIYEVGGKGMFYLTVMLGLLWGALGR